MLHTSNVKSVKGACKERLKQLIMIVVTADDDSSRVLSPTHRRNTCCSRCEFKGVIVSSTSQLQRSALVDMKGLAI